MKAFTVFLTVFVVFLTSFMIRVETQRVKQTLVMLTLECLPSFNLTRDELEKLISRDFENASKNVKCLSKCAVHKGNLIVNGVVNNTSVIETFSQDYPVEFVEQMIARCPNKTGKKDCDSIYEVVKCYDKEIKSKFN